MTALLIVCTHILVTMFIYHSQVISLLSPQAFLDIIAQLVTEETVPTGDIQRKALEILNKRLEENKMRFTPEHVSMHKI